MKSIFLFCGLVLVLGCKEEHTPTSVNKLSKSTSSFVVDVEYSVTSEGAGYRYIYKAIAKEQSHLENVSATWKIPEQAQIISESVAIFENGLWRTSLELFSFLPNPQVLVEFKGEAEGTPLGSSRLVRYNFDEDSKRTGKTVPSSVKQESSFPEKTHF